MGYSINFDKYKPSKFNITIVKRRMTIKYAFCLNTLFKLIYSSFVYSSKFNIQAKEIINKVLFFFFFKY